jgi:hypothetical protein
MDWIYRFISLILFLTESLSLFSALLTAKFNPKRNWLSLSGIILRGIILASAGLYFSNLLDVAPYILVIVTAVIWIIDLLFLFAPSSLRDFITSHINYTQRSLINNRMFFVLGNLILMFLSVASFAFLVFTLRPVI